MQKIQGLFSGGGAPEQPAATESESGLRVRPRPTFRDRQEELRAGLPDLSDQAVELAEEEPPRSVAPPPLPVARPANDVPPPLPLPLTRRSVPSLEELDALEAVAEDMPAIVERTPERASLRKLTFVAVALVMGAAGFVGARAIVADRSESPGIPAPVAASADRVAEVLVLEEIDTRPEPPVQLEEVVVDAPAAPPARRRVPREEAAAVARTEIVEPAPELPATPSRQDVLAALAPFDAEVRACADGHFGVVPVRVTVASSGRVTIAQVTGGTVVGTEAGSCIARALRQARFPAFSQDRFVVDYPFQL